MKRLILCLILGCSIAGAADNVQVVRNGKVASDPEFSVLITNVIHLLQSCTYYSSRGSMVESWDKAIGSDSFVHITFQPARSLKLEAVSNHGRDDYLVDEMLVALPEGSWASALLIKSGSQVHAFGKYDPRTLKAVAFHPAVGLSGMKPYSGLR